MSINLASKVSPVVDERFTKESITENIGMCQDYDWDGVKTISVYNIDTVPLEDYQRSGTSRYGNPTDLGDQKTDYSIEQDKSFTYVIDEGDSKSQMDIKKKEGASLGRQTKEVIIPSVDKYRLNVWKNKGALKGNMVIVTAATTKGAYEQFLDMNELLDDNSIPQKGRITYVTPSYYNKLKLDPSFVKASDIGQKMLINGQVGEVDGNKIIKAPSLYLSGLHALTIYPRCTASPKKINKYNRHDNPPGINGLLVEGRLLFDTFVLKAKENAIAVIVDNSIGMNAKSVEGATTGGTKLIYSLPGVKSTEITVKYKLGASAITLPTVGATVSGYTAYTADEIAASTNTHYMLVGLDKDGKVVFAEGGEIVKKA